MSEASTALPFITTIISYFSPAKSPHYAVVLAGVLSLVFICGQIDDFEFWLSVFIPIYLLVALNVALSFFSISTLNSKEQGDHLRFSRSMGASTAMLTLALTSTITYKHTPSFWACWVPCLAQGIIFLLYSYARKDNKETRKIEFNFVQLALITSTLLGAGCFSISKVAANWEGYLDAITGGTETRDCLLYTSPSPRDLSTSRMPSSA